MTQWELHDFERALESYVGGPGASSDPAHDISHVRRVVRTAKELADREGGMHEVVVPAAWLHDLIVVPKDSADRSQASHASAVAAASLLRELSYPAQFLEPIAHAITAHSFSAGVEPITLDARIVQDADRLDALGAIGVARCFSTGGSLGRALYSEADPFAVERPLDDARWTLDHFKQKLFRVAETMRTDGGAHFARERAGFMHSFMEQLQQELPRKAEQDRC